MPCSGTLSTFPCHSGRQASTSYSRGLSWEKTRRVDCCKALWSPGWGWLLFASHFAHSFFLIFIAILPRVFSLPEIGSLALVLSIPVVTLLGATIFELIRGYKSCIQLQKVRIQYLLLAIVIVWVGMSSNGSPALRPYPIDVMANIASAILIAFAILRYQLLDINIIIRKGLVYSVSVLIMGGGYFTIILLLTRLFVLDQSNSLLISIIAAIVVVGVLSPLRDRAQSWIDHALFRENMTAWQ